MMNTGFMWRCAFTLSAVLASAVVHAENLTQSQFWVGGTAVHDVHGASGGASSSATFDHSGPDGITGSGHAGYGPGVLTTSAHLKNPTSSEDVYTESTARLGDTITISAAGLNGQAGKVKWSLYFPSQLAALPDPSSTSGTVHTSAMVYYQFGSQKSLFGEMFDVGPESPLDGPVSTFNKPTTLDEFDFIFGQSIDLQIDLITKALASRGVDARVDNSVYWGGISVVTANGQQVGDFSVTSLSGMDWQKSYIPPVLPSVPEPSGMLLVLAGVGVLAFAGKRRQRADVHRCG